MPITVEITDTFEQWRVKTNLLAVNVELSANVISSNIGNLSQLVTITKSNLVAAINENTSNIGNLSQLVTIAKSNLVAAINETQLISNITGGKAFFTTSVRGLGANSTADSQSFGVKGETRKAGNSGVVGSNLDRNTIGYLGHFDYGVYGENGSVGVIGVNTGSNIGVKGQNSAVGSEGYLGHPSYGVYGTSTGSTSTSNAGVRGVCSTTNAEGLLGFRGIGVAGLGARTVGSGQSVGVFGNVVGSANIAIHGENTTTGKYSYIGWGTYALYASGNIYSTDDIIAASDERLKENIETIDNALNTVCSLRGVKYNLKSTYAKKIGLIAQEVETVVPEVVDKNSEYWGISYPNLVGLLVEAIKDLKKEIDELKKKV